MLHAICIFAVAVSLGERVVARGSLVLFYFIFKTRITPTQDIFLTYNSWENIGGIFGKLAQNGECNEKSHPINHGWAC